MNDNCIIPECYIDTNLIETLVPPSRGYNHLFKKLDNSEIWELRTLFSGICYRLFAFWDTETETLVVATHGIIKKTQKTPQKEIQRAEEIRKEYFNDKNNVL